MGGPNFPGWPSKRAYTFSPGSDFPTGSIQLWDNTTPDGGATIQLMIFGNPADPSGIPIREVYIPVIYGPIQFFLGYQGVPVGVNPDYVTQGSGCETVDFDAVFYLTLAYASGAYIGQPAYVFLRNLPTGAFRVGPVVAQVTAVTASLPLASSGGSTPNISLGQNPLPIADGGTGTATPQLIAGPNITITGTAFDWTISAAGSGILSLNVIAPIQSTGGPNPTLSLGIVPLNLGGTGYPNPQLNAGAGISVTGNIFQPTGANQWTVTNTGVTQAIAGNNLGDPLTGQVTFESKNGDLNITSDDPNNAINFALANPIGFCIAVSAKLSPATINGGGQTVTLPTLPSGQWYVECIVHGWGFTGGGSGSDVILMTGSNWGGSSPSDQVFGSQSTRTLYFAGIVPAGNNPSVTIASSSGTVVLNPGCAWISLGLKAIRIS